MSKAKFNIGDEVLIRGVVVQDGGCGNAYLIRTADECETWMFARACETCEIVAPTPPPNTVPVRIAVAVNTSGKWGSSGWPGADDDDLEGCAIDSMDSADNYRLSWVTAHVPLPEQPAEVEGWVQ